MSPPERHPLRARRARSSASCSGPTATGPHPVAVVLHGGFWRAQYGRKLHAPAVRRPRRARLGGVERRVPPRWAGCRAAASRARSTTSPPRSTTSPTCRRTPARRRARRRSAASSPIGHSRRRAPRGVAGDARRRRACAVTAVVAQAGVRRPAARVGARPLARRRRTAARRHAGEVPERYAAASPAERLPLGVPVAVDARRPRRHRPAGDERALRGGARGRRATRSSWCVEPGRGPLRPPRPGATRCGGR